MSRVAFVFPGQGSQRPGMGRALHDTFPEARRVFEEADDVLGEPFTHLVFDGSKEELTRTRNSQPALLAVSIAALRVLQARGAAFDAVAGHSLGEYSAVVAAGGLAFGEALRLTRMRGDFMQEAAPEGTGAMAAVLGLDGGTVAAILAEIESGLGEVVQPANFNGADQVVIGGAVAAVEAAEARLRSAGAKRTVRLPVSAPFHTRLMAPAAAKLAPHLDEASFSDLSAPLWNNVDAAPVRTAEAVRDGLKRQVESPVRWEEIQSGLAGAGVTAVVEVGEGRVLAGLARRTMPGVRVASVSTPGDVAQAPGVAA